MDSLILWKHRTHLIYRITATEQRMYSRVTSICSNSPVPLEQNTWNYSAESKFNFLLSHTLNISNSALSLQGQLRHSAALQWFTSLYLFILATQRIGWLQRLLKMINCLLVRSLHFHCFFPFSLLDIKLNKQFCWTKSTAQSLIETEMHNMFAVIISLLQLTWCVLLFISFISLQ